MDSPSVSPAKIKSSTSSSLSSIKKRKASETESTTPTLASAYVQQDEKNRSISNDRNEMNLEEPVSVNLDLDSKANISDNSRKTSSLVTSSVNSKEDFNLEYLRVFYDRLFPYNQMYKWLSYFTNDSPPFSTSMNLDTTPLLSSNNNNVNSNIDRNYFLRREWSFTIHDDIYIRYKSFYDENEFRNAIIKAQPHKIDIGAVFNIPPKDHLSVRSENFKPMERELIFDIDLTDYDGTRVCCSEANICIKCWQYMNMACKVLDTALREDFGFEDLLWIYSGRRGIHCWVSDEIARKLSNEGRSAIVDYLTIIKGSIQDDNNKNDDKEGNKERRSIGKMQCDLRNWPLHPSIQRAFTILEPLFEQHIISSKGQGLLASPAMWTVVVNTIPDEATRNFLLENLSNFRDPVARWTEIKRRVAGLSKELNSGNSLLNINTQKRLDQIIPSSNGKSNKTRLREAILALEKWKYEIVFSHCYPRLDANVTKGMNHLLKSPFCVHPKTGRVCVPIDTTKIDSFDPFEVPTVRSLCEQIDAYDAMNANTTKSKFVKDIDKTDLKESVDYMEKVLLKSLQTKHIQKVKDDKDLNAAVMSDW